MKLSIIFTMKTDHSITPKMAKLSIINNDYFRYPSTIKFITFFKDAWQMLFPNCQENNVISVVNYFAQWCGEHFRPCSALCGHFRKEIF
jgi:hypothetical protein